MPYTLLLADDSVTIQRVIELTFADEDVTVVAVGDGDLAIERLESSPPDIVLADIGMPGKNGYEVAQYIRQSPKLAHIPVMLLTGAFEPVDHVRASDAGCDGVLAKPFEPQLVIGRVKELLARPRRVTDVAPTHLSGPIVPPAAAPVADDSWAPSGELSGAASEPTAFAAPTSAPSAAPPQAELNDYFDRLDAAFSKLSPIQAPTPTPTPTPTPIAAVPPTAASSPVPPPPEPATDFNWFRPAALEPATTEPWNMPESGVPDLSLSDPSPHTDASPAAQGGPLSSFLDTADEPNEHPSAAAAAPVSQAFEVLGAPESAIDRGESVRQHDDVEPHPLVVEPETIFAFEPFLAVEPVVETAPVIPAEPTEENAPAVEIASTMDIDRVHHDEVALSPAWAFQPEEAVAAPDERLAPIEESAPVEESAAIEESAAFEESAVFEESASIEESAPLAEGAQIEPSSTQVTSSFAFPLNNPPPLPSLADAFAALLAAEQGDPAPTGFLWPASAAALPVLSEDLVEAVTRRVLDRLSDTLVRQAVADIASQVAERLIREEIERIKDAIR